MKLIIALAVVAAASAHILEDSEYEFHFTKFMAEHEKTYEAEEFFARFSVFKDNLDLVLTHNKKNASYTMAMNQFGDLTWEEFKGSYMGYNHVEQPFIRSLNAPENLAVEVSGSLDWRSSGAVTGVKDQGRCGSCWAFSTTGAMEGAYKVSSGQLVSFSEQQLVDCAGSYGNQGCNGGLMDYGFEYLKQHGACRESDYGYTGRDGSCKSCTGVAYPKSYSDVAQGSESGLMSAIAKGPVSIAIEADQMGFQFYSGGVFSGTCGHNLDHGVLAVGYGTDGSDYWIVKNSWGTGWGEKGYIRLVRNKDQCGLADAASYPNM